MKALGGGGGSQSKTSQKAKPIKTGPVANRRVSQKPSHAQLVAKWQENGGDKFAVETKKLWDKSAIEAERTRQGREALEKEKEEASHTAAAASDAVTNGRKSHQVARERMGDLSLAMREMAFDSAVVDCTVAAGVREADCDDMSTLQAAAVCRKAQLEELEMLEAMFVDEFFLVSPADSVDALHAALDSIDNDSSNFTALHVAAAHPVLEFALQMTVGGVPPGVDAAAQSDKSLVASILLRVGFPRLYPTPGHAPLIRVEDVMVTDAHADLKNKTLSTLAVLDEEGLAAAMLLRAVELQPDPCVYEMATWMSEHAFSFLGNVFDSTYS